MEWKSSFVAVIQLH